MLTVPPVIGASVIENGTTNGTVTDIEAAFKFKVKNGNSALKISYLEFKPQTIALNGRSKLEVKLVEDASNLGEVVVIGYGIMARKNLLLLFHTCQLKISLAWQV